MFTMNVISILRKTFPSGYMSTWKFGQTVDGSYVAISNKGTRKHFADLIALETCVTNFTQKYAYGQRTTPPIRRVEKQLALAI